MSQCWPSVLLSDICNPKQWPTISQTELTETGYPVYGANGKIGYYSDFNHERPTLLVTCRGATCGSLNICEPFSYVTGNSMALDDLDESRVDQKFLYYALFSRGFKDSITGTAQPQITRQSLSPVSIPLPPLPEQKRIAAILDKADAIRRKRQQAVKLTEELLRSVFLDMFGDPVTNPKGWEVMEFGDLCEELRYGTSNMCSTDRQDGDLPVLRIPNVIGGLINWDDIKHVQLPDAETKRLRLEQGDILFVRTNGNPEYIGRCAVYDDTRPALYASYLIRARLKIEAPCLPQYASSCFTFPTYRKRLVAEAKTTAGNFNINTEGLKSLKLPIPPLSEQERFLMIRDRLATVSIRYQSGVVASDSLFTSLLQRAFRGELS